MRRITYLTQSLFLLLGVFWTITSCQGKSKTEDLSNIEQTFRDVPKSSPIGVYWYWMSDNISKEGVIKDLQAMKAAGINRAYIGNIAQPPSDIPYGKVKIFTDEWWDIIHTALKTAGELDIEIGIFNSPGWSQSGGPWIKPQQAMRYLTSRKLSVKGPTQLTIPLPPIPVDAQEVRTIAYPDLSAKQKVTFSMTSDGKGVIDLKGTAADSVRSLIATFKGEPVVTMGQLYVKKGDAYDSIRSIVIDRSNPALNVGFDPYAPVAVSIPATYGSSFRLILSTGNEGAIEKVTLSSIPCVERYPEKSLAKMFQTPLPMWNDYLWDKQPAIGDTNLVINPSKVIDLTSQINKEGILTWNVPNGNWTIMRTYMVPTGVTNSPATPEGTGLEVDKMSKKHIAAHFDAFIGEILRRIPENDRKSFKIVVEDSYETGGQNWTDQMIELFKERYGYDPTPFIPVMEGHVVGSSDLSDRFLWDLRRLVADKVSKDYVGGLREISNKHGLTTWLENYGHWGFPGEFLQYGGESDEIAGEFWSEGSLGDIENRAASSCGHIYGKKKVWAESFTAGGPGFSRYPAIMKQRGDRFFTEGINSTLLHLFIQQPDDRMPGLSAPFGNEFNRNNTWFSHMNLFTDYLKRCNFMLQQGRYIADVAYFIGEDAPKMTGVRSPEIPKGYSYDYINAEVLQNFASVENGMLTLKSGMQYRVLVLPPLKTMRPDVLLTIKELVSKGMTLLGDAPEQSPSMENYPAADQLVKSIAREVWGSFKDSTISQVDYGKGKVYSGVSLEELFENEDLIPDFDLKETNAPLLFIHRTYSEGEIYFVSNQSGEKVTAAPAFRVTGKVPELWVPQTGEQRLLPKFERTSTTTTVPLELEAYESAFILFRKKGVPDKNSKQENYPFKEYLGFTHTPWEVQFDATKGGPKDRVTFETLTDWTQSKDSTIKYYSGKATYTTYFSLSEIPEGEIYIDLGKVMVMAKVKLNGKEVGGVWTAPYRLNISKQIKRGENRLEIEVVNNWKNRIIGDLRLEGYKRITSTNGKDYNGNSELQSSGLLGPVELQVFHYQMIQ
ncbi:MAG: glycosyl hydrolase [Bacteroidales bacterium]|jgi:hypothetical protein|nr:glycosyl hydrolase [Bacteroidales bacterium]